MNKKLSSNQMNPARQFITKAVFELLETADWNDLTVSSVCIQAEISRRTFYRHYRNLDQVLSDWFLLLEEQYLNSVGKLDHYDLERISREFFSFWKPYRARLHRLDRSGYPIEEVFFESAERIFKARAGSGKENLRFFSSGGFFALWLSWLREPAE